MGDQTKLCPRCAEEIPAEAQFCNYCGARFQVAVKGYCTNCHALREADKNGKCRQCGAELVDKQVESALLEAAPPPAGPPHSTPGKPTGAQSSPSRQIWVILALIGLGVTLVCAVIVALLAISGQRSQPTAVSQKPTALPSATTRSRLPSDTPLPTFTPSPVPPSPTITATSRPTFTPTPKFTPTRKPTSTPTSIPGLAIPPNAACFNYSIGEITCLDDSGWHTFTRDDMPYWLFDFTFCPDGHFWLSTTSGIGVSDGQTWTFYTEQPSGDLACGPDGSLWMVTTSEKDLRHFDGQQWTTYPPIGKLGNGDYADTIMDIAVSPTGLVWIGTLSSIASFDGTNWTIYEEGQGFQDQISVQTLVIDSQGKVWLSTYDGVWRFDGKKWTPFESQNLSMPQALAIDSRDRLWIGTYDNGISMYDGNDWAVYRRSNSKLSSDSIKSLAIDAQDRVWIGTEWGLNIFDGNNWQAYHVHTSDLVENEIDYLTVGGKGPALPPLIEKPTGTLEGRLVDGTQPVSGADVEVCVEYIGFMFSGNTPCSGQPFVRSTTTDTEGYFTFSDLPAGQYTVTFRAPGGKWMQYSNTLSIGSEQVTVNPGETTKLDEMDISKSK